MVEKFALVVLACESLHVCTVCIWRCEHARFCVEGFYALYINFHSFIHNIMLSYCLFVEKFAFSTIQLYCLCVEKFAFNTIQIYCRCVEKFAFNTIQLYCLCVEKLYCLCVEKFALNKNLLSFCWETLLSLCRGICRVNDSELLIFGHYIW